MAIRVNDRTPYNRLTQRFKAFTKIDDEESRILEGIIPITNFDSLMRENKITAFDSVSITSTGVTNIAVVPNGKRWIVHAIYITRTTGTFTFNLWGIRPTISGSPFCWMGSGSSVASFLTGPIPEITLKEGMAVCVNVDTHTLNGYASANILYEEEDAF